MSRYSGYQTDYGISASRSGYTSSSQNQSISFDSRSNFDNRYCRNYSGILYTGSSQSSAQTPNLRFPAPQSVRTFPSGANSVRTSLLYNTMQPENREFTPPSLSRLSSSSLGSGHDQQSRSSPSMRVRNPSLRHDTYERSLVNGDMPYQAPSTIMNSIHDGYFQRRDTLNHGLSHSSGGYSRDPGMEAERAFERGFMHGFDCGMFVSEALSETPQLRGSRQCTCSHSVLIVPNCRDNLRGNGRSHLSLLGSPKGLVSDEGAIIEWR